MRHGPAGLGVGRRRGRRRTDECRRRSASVGGPGRPRSGAEPVAWAACGL